MPQFKMLVAGMAIVMFAINALKKRDAESLGWALLVIMWAL